MHLLANLVGVRSVWCSVTASFVMNTWIVSAGSTPGIGFNDLVWDGMPEHAVCRLSVTAPCHCRMMCVRGTAGTPCTLPFVARCGQLANFPFRDAMVRGLQCKRNNRAEAPTTHGYINQNKGQ